MTINVMNLALHIEVLIGVSVLSVLLWPKLSTLTRKTPPYKVLVVATLCFAWIHGVSVSLLTSMPAMESICVVGVHICANGYGAAKLCVSAFFNERQYVVAAQGPRHKSLVYIISTILLIPFAGIIVLQTIFHVDTLEDGVCHIGVTREGAIPMVVYDCAFGLYQTSLFAFIMSRYISLKKSEDAQTAILRQSLKVVLVGSLVACALSFMNLFALTLHDTLPANLCYFLCFLDLLGSSCVLSYVMMPIASRSSRKPVVPKLPCPPVISVGVEEYEQELHIVAEMLKQMQTQGSVPIVPDAPDCVVSTTETSPLSPHTSQCLRS